MTNRTVLLVTHRISALRRADLVVVLEAGKLVQMGHHDELIASEGHYQDVAALIAPETLDEASGSREVDHG